MIRRSMVAVWAVALAGSLFATAPQVQEAERLLEGGQAEAALQILDAHLRRNKKDAEAWLVRSSAEFVLGDAERGEKDLDRALDLDPTLRQGWLNRAAVQMAASDPSAALDSLLRARDLDPSATDNAINIGAARLMLGQIDEASQEFEAYLARYPDEAPAFYLVATNYAMNGYAGLAVQYLQRAIDLDERARLRARVDPNFLSLADHPRFQSVLVTRSFRPAPGSHESVRTFDGDYAAGTGPLLKAVLDALFDLRQTYESQIEVAAAWAVIWGDMRIELRDGQRDGQGVVELTAPPAAYTAATWEQRTKRLFDAVFVNLQRQKARGS